MPFIARPANGQIIDPAWGTLVADAVVMRFATAAQRASQLVAPAVGQLTALDTAPGVVEVWNGSIWRLPAGAVAGRGNAAIPDGARTTAAIYDAAIATIAAFPYPVSVTATVHISAGYGTAPHTYSWDVIVYSTATPTPLFGPYGANAAQFAASAITHTWSVPAGSDPTWKVRVTPSTATAGNILHTGGSVSWIAYAA